MNRPSQYVPSPTATYGAHRYFEAYYCVALHNYMVDTVLNENPGLGVTKGYFNFHMQHSPHLASRLQSMRSEFNDAHFCRFLDEVNIPNPLPPGLRSGRLSMTPEVIGLADPLEMWGVGGSRVRDTRFVLLYRSHDLNNGIGLVFCLNTWTATFVDRNDEHIDGPSDPREWLKISDILSGWRSRIWGGKYVPVHRDLVVPIFRGCDPVGWRMQQVGLNDLDHTIRLWNEYVGVLVSEQKSKRHFWPGELTTQELTTQNLTSLLDQYNVQGFLRSFLLSAEKPPDALRFIAPGLRMPSLAFLAHTLSRARERQIVENGGRGTGTAVVPTTIFPLVSADGSLDTTAFEGLIIGVDGPAWEDSVALMLPADTALLPESAPRPTATRRSNPLFQTSQCPYGFDHSVQFKHLLIQWIALVTNDKWWVGVEGVIAGRDWLISRRDPEVIRKEKLYCVSRCSC